MENLSDDFINLSLYKEQWRNKFDKHLTGKGKVDFKEI